MHHNVEECPLQNSSCKKRPQSLKGPTRLVKLCVLGIFLPFMLVALPLYMRFRVYGHQLYPLAMSDMRLLDNKVSTTWCQRQLVKVNTTFNAFLLERSPQMSSQVKPLTMVRHLILEDDYKEYWGFYLLEGSSVTVSTCVRWPGASLIVIRGHKHLHECAYIGDDSSEELDELMEAIREKTYVAKHPNNATSSEDDDAPVNEPDMMKRHREGVEFHDPLQKNSTQNHTISKAIDTSDISDPVIMQTILNLIQEKITKRKRKPEDFMKAPFNSTIAKGENVQIESPHQTSSQETLDEILMKLRRLGAKGSEVLERVNKKFGDGSVPEEINIPQKPLEQKIDMKGRYYSKPAVEFDENIDKNRRRRDIVLANVGAKLAKDDEENDLAMEEGFVLQPDGIADHRGTVNETTLNDYSNSEFWSSFSSSEEALLNCAGLILNLPLTPHHKCSPGLSEAEAEETTLANTITYKVPVNGYYFFVFNSENEVQPNYIRVQFHLKKTVYNVSQAVYSCLNSSESCAMNLKFFSSEKVVMELPVRENDTLWNEEFVVVSECEPRTAIYVLCVIAVPVLVVLFAFS